LAETFWKPSDALIGLTFVILASFLLVDYG